ncbi:hypothetical protein [Streptomyces sp. NBC_00582]|uniref:hypothetical protein n=1 Tax=Streptomyces sp. NBC_00582 TaxID=2975783 RepID=UPI002E7FFF89|nr:hypothetical protein [Streptomyces sp. NBC_00582]WUB64436.1 hypothetical protein OG852_30610 [Streptomyces sp. NBC_00582]
MRTDTQQPLPMSPELAMAFHRAHEDRNAYISEQPWQIRMRPGFEASIPLPGCPHCWRDAEVVQWHVFAHEMWTIVEPCGHWFQTETPITVQRTGDGWFAEEEWLP